MAKIDIPINKLKLELAVQRLCDKGSKLEDLFLVVQSPIEYSCEKEFQLRLQEKMSRPLGGSRIANIGRKEYEIWGPDVRDVVKTVKFKVFFSKQAPQNLILDHKKFPYPKVSIRNIKSIRQPQAAGDKNA